MSKVEIPRKSDLPAMRRRKEEERLRAFASELLQRIVPSLSFIPITVNMNSPELKKGHGPRMWQPVVGHYSPQSEPLRLDGFVVGEGNAARLSDLAKSLIVKPLVERGYSVRFEAVQARVLQHHDWDTWDVPAEIYLLHVS